MAAAYTEKRMIGPVAAPLAETVKYSVPNDGSVLAGIIKHIRIANTSTTATLTCGLSLLAGGAGAGSAAVGNRLIPESLQLGPGAVYAEDTSIPMDPGEQLSLKGSAAGLTVTVTGLHRTS